jgi:broad specificity phosphatase PhoE
MLFIVIRHGETTLNKENRLQGSKGPNEGLTENGVRMVETLRDGLLVAPKTIYVSPLRRTEETARIINQRFDAPIVLVPELVERDFGSLSGKLRSEIDPSLVAADLEGRYDYRPWGGESVEDVHARILAFLSTLPLATDDTVFLITHRGIVRALYDLFPGENSGEVLPASRHTFRIAALPERNDKPA